MPNLATLTEIKDYLGVTGSPEEWSSTSDFDDFLTELGDNVEAILEEETNRDFASAQSGISQEAHDGTGTEVFYADYPVDTLTKVEVGDDPSSPDETLDTVPDDVDADGEAVLRRDGGVWPRGRKNIYLTYDALAYQPRIAKQALYEGIAYLYRRRGREHVSSRTVGEFGSAEMAALFEKLPAWRKAVRTLRVPVIA